MIDETFPELAWIDDAELRDGVQRAWVQAAADADVADLADVRWLPPVQDELDLPDERLVDHVRDVASLANDVSATLVERRGVDVDRDLVVAGALVHDVSKLYEFDDGGQTRIGHLLGHPHFGVSVVTRAGLPTEIAHIVLSHTRRTSVEPATLEAEIVRRADEVASAAIRFRSLDDLREA